MWTSEKQQELMNEIQAQKRWIDKIFADHDRYIYDLTVQVRLALERRIRASAELIEMELQRIEQLQEHAAAMPLQTTEVRNIEEDRESQR